jgi:2-phospho-L-lactate guanylyltransferase
LTDDPSLVPRHCSYIEDPGLGLNAAVARAAHMVAGAGASTMLVLPADLPFVSVDDICTLIDAGRNHTIVLSPDKAGIGTNALLMSPPGVIAPRFGQFSCAMHVSAARALGATVRLVHRPGLGADIDEPQDLEALVAGTRPRYAFLTHRQRMTS